MLRLFDPNDPEDAAKLQRRKDRKYFKEKQDGQLILHLQHILVNLFVAHMDLILLIHQGIVYGKHMLSHNVQLHINKNDPYYIQTYQNSLTKGAAIANVDLNLEILENKKD